MKTTTSKKLKKALIGITIVMGAFLVWTQTYSLNQERASAFITKHSYSRSHTLCVFGVAKALWAGGCPMVILMPNGYYTALPLYGYEEVPKDGYEPQEGDIAVFTRTKKHFWGHVTMYTGKQWISDFKQKRMNPYRDDVPYKIYRRNK